MRRIAESVVSEGFASRFLDPAGPCVAELLASGQLASRSAGPLAGYIDRTLAAVEVAHAKTLEAELRREREVAEDRADVEAAQ